MLSGFASKLGAARLLTGSQTTWAQLNLIFGSFVLFLFEPLDGDSQGYLNLPKLLVLIPLFYR